jgi:hypothetical protein
MHPTDASTVVAIGVPGGDIESLDGRSAKKFRGVNGRRQRARC